MSAALEESFLSMWQLLFGVTLVKLHISKSILQAPLMNIRNVMDVFTKVFSPVLCLVTGLLIVTGLFIGVINRGATGDAINAMPSDNEGWLLGI